MEINNNEKKIFVGTGIGSLGKPSVGLGLGTLGLFIAGIKAAKENGVNTIFHHKGDLGYDVSESEREKLIEAQMPLLRSLTDGFTKMTRLKFDHILTSEQIGHSKWEDTAKEVAEALQTFKDVPNWESIRKYTELQTTFVLHHMRYNGTIHKAGWSMSRGFNPEIPNREQLEKMIEQSNRSEIYFDAIHNTVAPDVGWDTLQTSYMPADIDCSTGFSRTPYTVTADEVRPVLGKSLTEFVDKNGNQRKVGEMVNRYQKTIVTPFEELFGEVSKGTTTEKVDEIQDSLIGIRS